MTDTLKQRITDDVKTAMRAKDKARLGTLRLITSAIKQIEVDERIELDDSRVLVVLDKMVKQRRDSISQFRDAGREELVEIEEQELVIIQEYMPAALSEEELSALIDEAISASGAASMQEMGKVMGILKPKVQGRADMGAVSATIKAKLSAA
ncbi:MAG: GatB/YqeY domain-containing protein [Gammaproteobacteria bacterium]|nr:GatB/YqeY domain-containing protein [Gammaproteobacteria bacterium]